MGMETLRILPSVDVESTLADNAAGISESSFIRWKAAPGNPVPLPEKRGGWTKFINTVFGGVIRELLAWQGFNSNGRLAVGATAGLYVIDDGDVTDITPQTTDVDIAVSLTSVVGTSTIRVDDVGSNATVYDVVVFNVHASIGGVMIYGAYPVDSVASADAFYIDAGITATSSAGPGGAVASFAVALDDSIITMTLADHIYAVGDLIAFPVATYVGGVLIQGQYLVLTVPTADTLTFNAQNTSTAATITNAVDNGVTTTFTYSGTYPLSVGDTFVVAGVTPSSYNNTYTVSSLGSNTVTATDATVHAAYVSGGTLFNSVSAENGGELNLTYYITPGPTIAGTGYGEAGYGDGGYGTGTPSPSHSGTPITVTDYWLSNWGEALVACVEDGPIYTWSSTTGLGNASIIPNAPLVNAGAFVAMPQQQVMAWGSTYNGVGDPLQIRWSDAGNYNTWTPTVSNQAGGYLIPTGSRIVRGIQGANLCYWWTDLGLYVAQYIGPPGVWGFTEVASGCGLIAPKAVAKHSTSLYWMSQKQFFVAGSNQAPTPLPCSVWDAVFQNLNSSYVDNIRAAPNAQFNEITWYYPSSASTGENDSWVCYNVVTGDWDYGSLNRTAWIDQSVLGPPIGAATDGYLYQHETSYDADGQAINAYFKTGYFSISNGHNLAFVDWMLPDMKWGTYSGSQTAQIKISFNVTDYAGDEPTLYGPFTVTKATQYIEPRFRGRFVQVIVESDDVGSFWRLGSIRYRFSADGNR
jgi:hypothetical protein